MIEDSLARPIEEAGRNLASGVATRLRNDIVSGVLKPSEKLSIDDLRASYNVSLSPMREALSRLTAEGFVVLEEKKGFRVAPVSKSNCLEIARMQMLLEPEALSRSMQLGAQEWEDSIVVAFHRLTRLERSERKDGAGVDTWETEHRKFHSALLSACGMPLLRSTCASLHDFSARYRRLFLARHPFDSRVPDEHLHIMEAALDRDTEKAASLISAHIERTANNIIEALDAGKAT